jgi:hypothetical protein
VTTGPVALASVVAAVALATACDGNGSDPSPWSATVAGLCAAADQARTGDTADARRTFFDQSHDALHRLADDVTQRDRAVAAALLEAKERVEAGLEAGSPTLPADFEALVAASRVAVRATGDPVPPPCQP